MRILLTCSQCKHRYDVSKFEVGARVRCNCGQVMVIPEPKVRESKVVRCSNCGAPRVKNATSCGFCDADFTIHERDLNTVCPNCMARVSDRAKFCNQCGDSLSAETLAGEASAWSCPQCGDKVKLHTRQLGKQNVAASECQICAGLWISHSAFKKIRKRAMTEAAHMTDLIESPPKPAELRPHTGKFRRPCAQCGTIMNRKQYARGSGVIIDICRHHGIWFDAKELHQIMDWIARGGHAVPRKPGERQETSSSLDKLQAYKNLRQPSRKPPVANTGWNQSYSAPQANTEDVLSSVVLGVMRMFDSGFD